MLLEEPTAPLIASQQGVYYLSLPTVALPAVGLSSSHLLCAPLAALDLCLMEQTTAS